jgi:mannose-6-phosphate isomerase-like protein (cupin superfamily)
MSCQYSSLLPSRTFLPQGHSAAAPRIPQKILASLVTAAFLLISLGVSAQTMQSDHWSPAQLLERAKHLQQLAAAGDGSASETLTRYPHHYTMLAFRNRAGGGELHEHDADLFYILDGHSTIMTGGELVNPKTVAPGEVRADSVKGGTSQELHPGDVVHIPAGMPHQMRVAPGDTVTYFVVKIEESPGSNAH